MTAIPPDDADQVMGILRELVESCGFTSTGVVYGAGE